MANVLASFSAILRIRLADEAGMFGGVEADAGSRDGETRTRTGNSSIFSRGPEILQLGRDAANKRVSSKGLVGKGMLQFADLCRPIGYRDQLRYPRHHGGRSRLSNRLTLSQRLPLRTVRSAAHVGGVFHVQARDNSERRGNAQRKPPTTGLARRLERIQAKLAAGGTRLAVGVSTALEGVGRLSDGYPEAYVAVQSIRPEGGVACLEDLNPFEYLALRSDATAQGLVSPAIADFLAEDAGKGGTLTRTLLAYVEADLNVSSAAEQLLIPANTAHYRLARIAKKPGFDLRNVLHPMELLVAVALAADTSMNGLPALTSVRRRADRCSRGWSGRCDDGSRRPT